MILTLGAFIGHKFMFDELSEDFVAATMSEAGDGRQKTHRNNLMVLHPHFNLGEEQCEHKRAKLKIVYRNRLTISILMNYSEIENTVMIPLQVYCVRMTNIFNGSKNLYHNR